MMRENFSMYSGSSTDQTSYPLSLASGFNNANLSLHVPAGRPPYEPERWNRSQKLLKRCNCVGYALNLKDLRWVIPGFLQTKQPLRPSFMDPEDYDQGFRKDGLIAIDPDTAAQTEDIPVIASFYSSKWREAHSFRLDNNGKYSYKNGDGLVRNTDLSGREILNLEDADLGSYTIRIGYYTIPKEGIHYL